MKKFKILLINPNVNLDQTMGPLKFAMTPIAPLGLAYLEAMLKKYHYDVVLMDLFEKNISADQLSAYVQNNNVRIIGFSILTPNMPRIRPLIKELRLHNPSVKILAGNIHASVYAIQLLKEMLFDFVIDGEGEYTLLELVQALEKDLTDYSPINGLIWRDQQNNIKTNPKREQIDNLDELPFPTWDDLDLKNYKAPPTIIERKIILPVLFRRGCMNRCSFCSQNVLFPHMKNRSIANLLDEIERNIEQYNISWFGFQDSSFPMNKKEAFEFTEGMTKRGLDKKCKWLTEMNYEMLSFDVLKALKDSGLFLIMFGFETGSQKILDQYKKNQTLEKAHIVMEWTKKLNIFTFGLFMIGLPGETEESIYQTIAFANSLDPEIAKFNRFIPYPGSPLYNDIKKDIPDFDHNEEAFTAWSEKDIILNREWTTIEPKRLRELQKEAVKKFYFRPKKILQMLRLNVLNPYNFFLNLQAGISLFLNKK